MGIALRETPMTNDSVLPIVPIIPTVVVEFRTLEKGVQFSTVIPVADMTRVFHYRWYKTPPGKEGVCSVVA